MDFKEFEYYDENENIVEDYAKAKWLWINDFLISEISEDKFRIEIHDEILFNGTSDDMISYLKGFFEGLLGVDFEKETKAFLTGLLRSSKFYVESCEEQLKK
jgi:hypothetical protein